MTRQSPFPNSALDKGRELNGLVLVNCVMDKGEKMNKRTQIIILSLMLFVGGLIALFARIHHSPIKTPANGLPEIQPPAPPPGGFSVFVKARKLTTIFSDPDSELPNFFEREVEVSVDGNAFRLEKVDPAQWSKEIEMFDGGVFHRIVFKREKKIEEIRQKGPAPYDALEFNFQNLGLIPVLSYLSDPATQSRFLGRTARKEDKLEVNVGGRLFVLYLDSEHIIRKVQIGKYTIEYGDYRDIEGVRVPFIARVFTKGHLFCELIFTEINLHPVFPPTHFSGGAS